MPAEAALKAVVHVAMQPTVRTRCKASLPASCAASCSAVEQEETEREVAVQPAGQRRYGNQLRMAKKTLGMSLKA